MVQSRFISTFFNLGGDSFFLCYYFIIEGGKKIMNGVLNGRVVKVKRGTFSNPKDGSIIDYCKFYALVQCETNENQVGFDYESFSCKAKHYDKLVKLLQESKQVPINVEFVKQLDGNFRRISKKIGDYELN